MGLPKKCFCCKESHKPAPRSRNLKRKIEKCKDEKVLSVSVVRLENDTTVENYIRKNKVKTDFKKSMCSIAKRNVKDSSQKIINQNSANHSSESSEPNQLGIQDISSTSNESCDFAGFDDCPPLNFKSSDGIESSNAVSGLETSTSVLVTKLENSNKPNNVKTGLTKISCSAAKIVKNSKKVNKNFGNHSVEFSECSKLKIEEISTSNNVSCDFTAVDDCPPLHIISPNGIDSSNAISISGPSTTDGLTTDKTLIVDKKNDVISDVLECDVKISASKKNTPRPISCKKCKVEEKTFQQIDHKSLSNFVSKVPESVTPDEKIISIKKDSYADASKKKKNLKRKISPDIEEPLSLITKLTGCQIPPSKVKVLPLTSCISSVKNDASDSTIVFAKNNNITVNKNHNKSTGNDTHTINDNCSSSDTNHLSCKETIKCRDVNDSKPVIPEKIERSEDDVRTVYDVMEYISVVLPSWNLHILSDTNTFCICQVTRGKNGVPNISKCIELDDHFNGKVHIYEQHCKRFDGVYNSEDAVAALIKEVDEIS